MLRFLLLALLLVALQAHGAPAGVAQAGPAGLESLRVGRHELLTRAEPYVEYYIPQTAAGAKGASPGEPTHRYDAASATHFTAYPWGEVRCRFLPGADRLDLEVTLENRGPDPIFHLSVNLLELRLPAAPQGKEWQEAHVTNEGIDGVPAVLADYGSGALLWAGETFTEDYEVAFYKLPGQPPNSYALNVRTVARRTSDTIHQDLPLPAGARQTMRLSLRFGAGGSTLRTLGRDLYAGYAKAHPRRLKWADRRPIGAILLSSPAPQHRSAKNPRGWLNDPALNALNPKAFRQRILKWADESVHALGGAGAQGMIFWDLEGEELPHPTTYLGDPRVVGKFAPEMDAVADEMFAKFRAAGLRTGVCIRPSHLVPQFEKGSSVPVSHNHMGFDPVQELSAKIAYAEKRWGCSIFYVDTNVTWAYDAGEGGPKNVVAWPMRAELFRRLGEKHPEVLLIPEFQYFGYYTHTTAYRELSTGATGTPEDVLAAYPDAFSVIKVEDEKLFDHYRPALLESVRRGDLLLFPGWYNPPINAKVRSLYEAARGH